MVSNPNVWYMPIIPALGRLRQEDQQTVQDPVPENWRKKERWILT
jgi:hypothetical protein